MSDREMVIKGLECCMSERICASKCPYKGQCDDGGYYYSKAIEDAIALLKEREIMSPDKFKEKIVGMFSSIWDCEIDHPVFQDKVGELMLAVVQLYTQAVKWK